MRKNQKNILLIGVIFIVGSIIYWYTQGSETFTKTKVLIDNTSQLDKILGIENKQYVDKFTFGLLPSGTSKLIELLSLTTVSGFVVIISGVLIFILRKRKKEII